MFFSENQPPAPVLNFFFSPPHRPSQPISSSPVASPSSPGPSFFLPHKEPAKQPPTTLIFQFSLLPPPATSLSDLSTDPTPLHSTTHSSPSLTHGGSSNTGRVQPPTAAAPSPAVPSDPRSPSSADQHQTLSISAALL
uniref:Uncharacterized protein n=1 Tax=Populus alba TaxID=43335 RepID=A0A4U5Q7Q3_POPAL|nr:hypothetical protein D5086_0000140330 [Populus alba]